MLIFNLSGNRIGDLLQVSIHPGAGAGHERLMTSNVADGLNE